MQNKIQITVNLHNQFSDFQLGFFVEMITNAIEHRPITDNACY